MDKQRKRVFYCYFGQKEFNTNDFKILETEFDVYKFQYKTKVSFLGKVLSVLESFLKAIYFVPKCDVVYSFFVAYHCFFPVLIGRMLGKRIVLTIGGFDAMSIPSIKYGIFYQKGLLPFISKIIYRLADVILPVDSSLASSINYYADPLGIGYVTGFKNHVRGIRADVFELPTGYDPNKYFRNMAIMREKKVLALASIDNYEDFKRKGYDLILEAAKLMPDIKFSIVGITEKLKSDLNIKLDNLEIIDFIAHSEIVDMFSRYKVFLQLSMAEGLPNTLCEAMLCECIPVGSNVNGIPKAIGDTGFIINKRDVFQLELFIREALNFNDDAGLKARQRIIALFSYELRKEKLIQHIMP